MCYLSAKKPYPIGALLSPLKRAGGAVPFMTGMAAHLLLAKPFYLSFFWSNKGKVSIL
jgi:hypothetical protein